MRGSVSTLDGGRTTFADACRFKMIHTMLTGKKILLISPFFFNYENVIREKMEQLGAEVRLYNERSVSSAFDRALIKVIPGMFNGRTRKYCDSIIKDNSGMKFDYILIVRCDMFTVEMLESLRTAFPDAKMCLHLWDSVKNIPQIDKKIRCFDIATSFDKGDCNAGYGLSFRPLFYSDEFAERSTSDTTYDISFCGTVHSDRYRVIRAVEEQCKENGLNFYKFCYLQSEFMYSFYKMTKKEFRGTKKSDFAFEKKPSNEIADIENRSAAILDIQHPKQTGLTMRTVEMLGMKKKLITTNCAVKEYDFYNPDNICIIDRDHPVIDKEFILKPYVDISPEIYKKYSLENWIYDVLGIDGTGECVEK